MCKIAGRCLAVFFMRRVVLLSVLIIVKYCSFFQLCTLFIIITFIHRDEALFVVVPLTQQLDFVVHRSQCYTGTVTGRRLHRGP